MDMINFLEVEVSKNDWGGTNLGFGSEAQKSGSHHRVLNLGLSVQLLRLAPAYARAQEPKKCKLELFIGKKYPDI